MFTATCRLPHPPMPVYSLPMQGTHPAGVATGCRGACAPGAALAIASCMGQLAVGGCGGSGAGQPGDAGAGGQACRARVSGV